MNYITLNDFQLQERGKELSNALFELDVLRDEKKAAQQAFKEREQDLSNRIRRLSDAIRTRQEAETEPLLAAFHDESVN